MIEGLRLPCCLDGRRQPLVGGTSRISREAYVRICERLGVKFPGATRRWETGRHFGVSARAHPRLYKLFSDRPRSSASVSHKKVMICQRCGSGRWANGGIPRYSDPFRRTQNNAPGAALDTSTWLRGGALQPCDGLPEAARRAPR
jgi:hypothetical protein